MLDLVKTGVSRQTGGRVAKLCHHVGERSFFLYGDGVAEIGVEALRAFHRAHGKICTGSAVWPPSSFDALQIGEGEPVRSFTWNWD